MKPVSSRQISRACCRWSFFYPGPLRLKPVADTLVIPFFGRPLRALGGQATGSEEPPDVVGVVRHAEPVAHPLGDAPTGPEGGAVADSLGPGENGPYQLLTLAHSQSGRPPRGGVRLQASAAMSPERALPAPHGAAIDAQPLRDRMHRDVAS
jgi:hypothetical protein